MVDVVQVLEIDMQLGSAGTFSSSLARSRQAVRTSPPRAGERVARPVSGSSSQVHGQVRKGVEKFGRC